MTNWIINLSSTEKPNEALCSYVISCLPSKLRRIDPHSPYTAVVPVFRSLIDSESLRESAEEIVRLLTKSAEIFEDKKPNVKLSEQLELIIESPANDIDLKRWIKQLTNPSSIFTCKKTLNTCLASLSQIDLSCFAQAEVIGTDTIEMPRAELRSDKLVANSRQA